jgi:5'-nucleotidase
MIVNPKGKQMIEVLNKFHITAACLGNHDLDFGLDVLETHIANSNFPWIISNVFDVDTKIPLGDCKEKIIIEANGFKIGVIGLVEQEWIATLSTISYDEIQYESYIEIGKKLANELKNDHVIKINIFKLQNFILMLYLII